MPTKTQYTPAELKKAYQIVTEHLSQALIKAAPNQPIRCGKLGSFKKTEQTQKCGWDGNTYAYYRLLFKPFSQLKQELNKALAKKYNR